jgi:hypothetical protein
MSVFCVLAVVVPALIIASNELQQNLNLFA